MKENENSGLNNYDRQMCVIGLSDQFQSFVCDATNYLWLATPEAVHYIRVIFVTLMFSITHSTMLIIKQYSTSRRVRTYKEHRLTSDTEKLKNGSNFGQTSKIPQLLFCKSDERFLHTNT